MEFIKLFLFVALVFLFLVTVYNLTHGQFFDGGAAELIVGFVLFAIIIALGLVILGVLAKSPKLYTYIILGMTSSLVIYEFMTRI